jgi:uncharacterized damage-inducible protein DinB
MRPIFQMFANYNGWANARLYAAAAQLPDAEYRADHGAFFKSVHGTLNHLLVGDRIWMQRLTGEGDAPTRLDAILFEELAPLRAARAAEDGIRHIVDVAEKEQDGLIELCGVPLNNLLGNVAECKHEARNRENGHQRPDLGSVRSH